MDPLNIILITTSILWLFAFSAFGMISLREGEKRATMFSFAIGIPGALLLFWASSLPANAQLALVIIIGILLSTAIILFLLPIGRVALGNDTPRNRFDERDIMFARARLQPGSPQYESYYQMRPENREVDEKIRAKAGLLSPNAQLANPYLFSSPEGSFWLTENLREAVDGPVSEIRHQLSTSEMTSFIKHMADYYGALHVGITELKPYHVYSHIGRGSGTYGTPISIEHRYAIAVTVEMDFEMMSVSPEAQVTMESARQYVESARIAVQLAGAIRALGFPARAHIDGNYRVIAPLVARDAGLGELGRMGLLMTPSHGPRVRLGVVTTNLDLTPDKRVPDPSVIDFCTICTKCAKNCPSKSIPFDERNEIDGVIRWKINPETCFHYWNVIGTDCGRCMAVCPYSHPATISHNLIRWGNAKSGAFRRFANWMDDLFYGKHPPRREPPEWTKLP